MKRKIKMKKHIQNNKKLISACYISILLMSGNLMAQKLDDTFAKIGPKSNVSIAVQNARWAALNPELNTLTFRSMDRLFTTRKVPHSGTPTSFDYDTHKLNFNYKYNGKTYTAQEFLDRNYTNAMMIIKNGKVVYEKYRNMSKPSDHFIGWSTTKSLVSILVGCALEEGKIKSLDEDITSYLPELKNSAYKGVTIRQVLGMRSGVNYEERYDFAHPGIAASNHITSLVKNVTRFVDAAKTIKRKYKPGEVFEYKTLDTAVLGLLIERITDGGNISAYMTKHLWEPLGTESDGFFLMDGQPGVGREFTGAGFNSTLRDYARIGLMMLHNGKYNGKQIVSKKWVDLSTKSVGPENKQGGYGYQWWTMANSKAYSAEGLQGQYIYVNPEQNTVIVKFSHYPPGDEALYQEAITFFEAASKWKI
jgi:CubicO group peptidase (beta-lactamase class C family)